MNMPGRRLTIALAGTRGVPARYSGFETCAAPLGARLVERGHDVTVYCRAHHSPFPARLYRGMRRVVAPTVKNKYLETIVHATTSTLHALTQRFDVILYFIAGNSPDAVRGAKALFNGLVNAGAAEQFADERRVIGSLIGSPNQVECVMASFEKRQPNFVDPG